VVLLFVLAFSRSARAATSITVTNQAMQAYVFNAGAPNQTLTLTRGETYVFQVNTPGHPFHITTAPGLPVQDLVDPSLVGNGAATGSVTFTVPLTGLPATLFYQCSVHTVMQGTLQLVAAAAAPAMGVSWSTVFGVALLATGVVAVRRRRTLA
jgi:hypothetical protein